MTSAKELNHSFRNTDNRLSRQPVDHLRTLDFPLLPLSDPNPSFISESRVEVCSNQIRETLNQKIFNGVKRFTHLQGLGPESIGTSARRKAWLLATKAGKYNAVYFMSRSEAEDNIDFVEKNADIIDAIGRFQDERNGVQAIASHALNAYVTTFDEVPMRKVKTAKKSIPRYAIQGYDQDTLVIGNAFLDPDKQNDAYRDNLDWHDLAHVLAATASNGIYGVKYHDGLDVLPRYYRAITEGEGMSDASGPPFSDGLLFTQLSKPIFEKYESMKNEDGSYLYSYDQIQKFIMQDLFAYLGGSHELYHPGLGMPIKAGRAIDPLELAVCIQNKRYERRAAEFEKKLFVRGTPEGPRGSSKKDPLVPLTRSERIKAIASPGNDKLYFEARNLTRHRAHEDALGQFAGYLLQQKIDQLEESTFGDDRAHLLEDIKVLEATVAFYQMEDIIISQESNLYTVVNDILELRKERYAH